jgi:histidine triad (HIT) family protein
MKKKLIAFFLIKLVVKLVVVAFFFKGTIFSNSEKIESFCPFCDNKIIESQKYYEDEFCYGLYSHRPLVEGHCLIVPKRHIVDFCDLSQEEIISFQKIINKTHLAAKDVFLVSSYFIMQKNGKNVGQTVDHLHFHYIPRKAHDTSVTCFIGKFLTYPLKGKIKPIEMSRVTRELSKKIYER